jgi:hypothetical protein
MLGAQGARLYRDLFSIGAIAQCWDCRTRAARCFRRLYMISHVPCSNDRAKGQSAFGFTPISLANFRLVKQMDPISRGFLILAQYLWTRELSVRICPRLALSWSCRVRGLDHPSVGRAGILFQDSLPVGRVIDRQHYGLLAVRFVRLAIAVTGAGAGSMSRERTAIGPPLRNIGVIAEVVGLLASPWKPIRLMGGTWSVGFDRRGWPAKCPQGSVHRPLSKFVIGT